MKKIFSFKILGICVIVCAILGVAILVFVLQKASEPKNLAEFPRLSQEQMGEIEVYKAMYLTRPVEEIYGYENYYDFNNANHIDEKMNFIHHSCSGKGFVEYRNCLIQKMSKIQQFIVRNDEENKIFEKFYDGIRFEIANYENYKKVDKLPPLVPKFHFDNEGRAIGESGEIIDFKKLTYNEDRCTALAKIDLIEADFQEYYYPYIWLSFSEGQEAVIEQIFPNFSAKILQKWDEGSYYGKPRSNPCWFRTFGPESGSIIHSATNNDGDFLFIVAGGGGGSGDFYYYTFFRKNGSKDWQVINEIPGYGVHPFDFDYDNRGTIASDMRITEFYKNSLIMPWVYLNWEDNFYIADKIKEMLSQIES